MGRRLLFLGLFLSAVFLATVAAAGGPRVASDRMVELAIAVLEPPLPAEGPPKAFTVAEGEKGAEIGERLAREGFIRNPTLFRFLLTYYGVGRGLKAGRYSLPAGIGVQELIQALIRGREDLVAVTLPEGRRAEEVAALLEEKGVARRDEFLHLALTGDADFTPGQPLRPVASLEGYLFPDTYLVPKDFGAQAFLRLMFSTFQERFTDRLQQAAQEQGLTVHQVVILASIVEREAVLPAEQPVVAGVLLNRLREGMPLATDPTIQYALVPPGSPPPPEGYWKRDLTVEDLRLPSPYNTYLVQGFPPTPIANPGLGALQAVVHPQESTYRYFVAKPDGSHAFSTTFAEHLRNVALYQPR